MHDALAYHSGGDYSDNAIGTIFSDENNRVPNEFFRERFSCRYIRLGNFHAVTFVWASEISTVLLA